ncbi:MAG: hypothetical protein OEV59_06680 [Deltaproteobacteria bacterium]|nr:hypothetical protein [Deltaproteobacteria bacterium]
MVQKDSCDVVPADTPAVSVGTSILTHTDAGGNNNPAKDDDGLNKVSLAWASGGAGPGDYIGYKVFYSTTGAGAWVDVTDSVTGAANSGVAVIGASGYPFYVTASPASVNLNSGVFPGGVPAADTTMYFAVAHVDYCLQHDATKLIVSPKMMKDSCDVQPPKVVDGSLVYNYSDSNGNGTTTPRDDNGAGSVKINWTNPAFPADFVGYNIYMSKTEPATWPLAPGTPSAVMSIAGTATTADVTTAGAAGMDPMFFMVRAIDYCGVESANSTVTGKLIKDSCDAAPIHTPAVSGGIYTTIFSHTDIGGNGPGAAAPKFTVPTDVSNTGTVDLTWNSGGAVLDYIGYKVFYSPDNATWYDVTKIATGAADTGVLPVPGANPSRPFVISGTTTSVLVTDITPANVAVPATPVAGNTMYFAVAHVDYCLKDGSKLVSPKLIYGVCSAIPDTPTGLVYNYSDGVNLGTPFDDDNNLPIDSLDVAPAVGGDPGFVYLKWNAAAGAASYKVFAYDVAMASYVDVMTLTTFPATEEAKINSTTAPSFGLFKFAVKSVNYCGVESAAYSALTATSIQKDSCDLIPSSPTPVTATHTDPKGNVIGQVDDTNNGSGTLVSNVAGKVSLSWPAIGDLDAIGVYAVYYAQSATAPAASWTDYTANVTITGATTADVKTDGITSLTEMYFKVKAKDYCGRWSDLSTTATDKMIKDTCDAAPGVPSGLAYTHNDSYGNAAPNPKDVSGVDGKVHLAWTNSMGAPHDVVSYNVYSIKFGGVRTLRGNFATTSAVIDPAFMVTGDKYSFVVTAVDYCGLESGDSAATGYIKYGSCSFSVVPPNVDSLKYSVLSVDMKGNVPPRDDNNDGAALPVTTVGQLFLEPVCAPADCKSIDKYEVLLSTGGAFTMYADANVFLNTFYEVNLNISGVSSYDPMTFAVKGINYCTGEKSASATAVATYLVKDTCDAVPGNAANLVFNYSDKNGNGPSTPKDDDNAGQALDIAPVASDPGSVTLSWSAAAPADVVSYNVYISPNNAAPWTLLVNTGSTNTTDVVVDTSTIASLAPTYFAVKAVDYCGYESVNFAAHSGGLYIRKNSCDLVPDNATGLQFPLAYVDVGGKSNPPRDVAPGNLVYIEWTAVANMDVEANSYKVYYSNNNIDWTLIDGTTTPSVTALTSTSATVDAGGVADGVKMYFAVKAVDYCGRESANYNTMAIDRYIVKGICSINPNAPTNLQYTYTDQINLFSVPKDDDNDGVGVPPYVISGAGHVHLGWTPSTSAGVDTYTVWAWDGFAWNDVTALADPIASLTTSAVSLNSTTAPYQMLRFAVRAVNNCGLVSVNSNETTDILKDSCDELPPTSPWIWASHTDASGNWFGNPIDDTNNGKTKNIADTTGKVSLNWGAVGSYDFLGTYKVYHSNNASAPAASWTDYTANVSMTGATSADVDTSGVTSLDEMYFKVAAVDYCGLESDLDLTPATSKMIKDTCDAKPAALTNVKYDPAHPDAGGHSAPPKGDDAGFAYITWSAAPESDVVQYKIYAIDEGGLVADLSSWWPWSVTFPTPTSAKIDMGVFAGALQKFKFGVTAVDYCGLESSRVNTATYIKYQGCTTPLPSPVDGVNYNHSDLRWNWPPRDHNGNGQVKLQISCWAWPNCNVMDTNDAYNVYYKTSVGGAWTLINPALVTQNTVNQVAVDVSSLPQYTTMYFNVKAKNSCTGAESASFAVAGDAVTSYIVTDTCTAPPAPDAHWGPDKYGNDPGADVDTFGNVTLTWTAEGDVVNVNNIQYTIYDMAWSWPPSANISYDPLEPPVKTQEVISMNPAGYDRISGGVTTVDYCGYSTASWTPWLTKGACSAPKNVDPAAGLALLTPGTSGPDTFIQDYVMYYDLINNYGGNISIIVKREWIGDIGNWQDYSDIYYDPAWLGWCSDWYYNCSYDMGGKVFVDWSGWWGGEYPTYLAASGDMYNYKVVITNVCNAAENTEFPLYTQSFCGGPLPTVMSLDYNHQDAMWNWPPKDDDGAGKVKLWWPMPGSLGATANYNVYMSEDGGVTWGVTPVATACRSCNSATVNVGSVVPFKKLAFKIRAVDACGAEGLDSPVTSVIMKDSCDSSPSAPSPVWNYTDMYGSNPPNFVDGAGKATLSWIIDGDVTQSMVGYDVQTAGWAWVGGWGGWIAEPTNTLVVDMNPYPVNTFLNANVQTQDYCGMWSNWQNTPYRIEKPASCPATKAIAMPTGVSKTTTTYWDAWWSINITYMTSIGFNYDLDLNYDPNNMSIEVMYEPTWCIGCWNTDGYITYNSGTGTCAATYSNGSGLVACNYNPVSKALSLTNLFTPGINGPWEMPYWTWRSWGDTRNYKIVVRDLCSGSTNEVMLYP